jgi:hypothetical protein
MALAERIHAVRFEGGGIGADVIRTDDRRYSMNDVVTQA